MTKLSENRRLVQDVDSGNFSGDARPSCLPTAAPAGVRLNDFYAHMPSHTYIFGPTGDFWPAASVNSRIGRVSGAAPGSTLSAAAWLDRNRAVEQVTWAPGKPMHIRGRLIADGGWIDRKGCATFNLYRPPLASLGDASQAQPWVDHIRYMYPSEADHITHWLAHRVQKPHEKINHALVLGGAQGIGKDTLLEPVKQAIGPWNFAEVSPQHLLRRFNGFAKSVIIRVSEARDLGDVDRFAFYDHMKTYTAAPPDVLRVDEKHLREYCVFNVCGVIITSNHKNDGIFLPEDDRRHFVAWSALTKESFSADYWRRLWAWYGDGGTEHVAAYLKCFDLSGFDAKAPPPKTDAFWDIVGSNSTPEDGELRDSIEMLCTPVALTLADVAGVSAESFRYWLLDRRNSRTVPHRLETCGYRRARNPATTDGRWKVNGKNVVVYVKHDLSNCEAIAAAQLYTQQNRSF